MNDRKNNVKYEYFYSYIIRLKSLISEAKLYNKDDKVSDILKSANELCNQGLLEFEHLNFKSHEFFNFPGNLTPRVSILVTIFNKKDEILLCKDATSNEFKPIIGECELYKSPLENANYITYQKISSKIKDLNLIGIFENVPLDDEYEEISKSTLTVPEYIIVVKGSLASKFEESMNLKFFKIDDLPQLDKTISKELLLKIFSSASKDIITIE